LIFNFHQHLIILPILLPLLIGSSLLFFDERNRTIKTTLSLMSAGLLVVIAAGLMVQAKEVAPAAQLYRLGNWPAPFAIVLVLDRLSGLMVVLSSCLGLAALIFAQAGTVRAGPHFHSMMQFLLAGINGAFLTGDLFNLFVFFEVMLSASYALALHGTGLMRVRAGLHYVAINLLASAFFLIGAALIYGVTGTLNMADIAVKLAQIPADDLILFEAGAAILGLAFLVKAGMWPLNFWLPATYSAAHAPIGAIFAILSKVGLYVILRLSLLVFGAKGSVLQGFGNDLLFYGGLVTIGFGIIGVLSAQAFGRLGAYCVIISSGTILTAIGTGNPALTGVVVFYLLCSTLALGAFFLLVELIERAQDTAANVLAVTMEVYGDEEEEEEDEVGLYLPATLAILGACFGIAALLIIGMPPFAGFLAKFMLVSGIFNPQGLAYNNYSPDVSDWLFVLMIILSGLAVLIAMSRAGIRTFWGSLEGNVPKVMVIEIIPIVALLSLCLLLTVIAGPTMRTLDSLGRNLHQPMDYINSVLGEEKAQ